MTLRDRRGPEGQGIFYEARANEKNPASGQPCHASPPIPAGQPLFDIDPFSGLGEAGIDLNSVVSTMERQLITKALERSIGVRSKAAQLLGLNRTTLLKK